MPTKKRGCCLTLCDIDEQVQAYIKALRKAGTPVSIQVVLAAAEGSKGEDPSSNEWSYYPTQMFLGYVTFKEDGIC